MNHTVTSLDLLEQEVSRVEGRMAFIQSQEYDVDDPRVSAIVQRLRDTADILYTRMHRPVVAAE